MTRTAELQGTAGGEWERLVDTLPWYVRVVAAQGPLGFQAGDKNLYRYVGNHPTNATDPTGLDEKLQSIDDPRQISLSLLQPETRFFKSDNRLAAARVPFEALLTNEAYWKERIPKNAVSKVAAFGDLSAFLDLGCNGLCAWRLGQRDIKKSIAPEKMQGVKCYLSLEKAKQRKCEEGQEVLIFAKRGAWKGSEWDRVKQEYAKKGPKPKENGDGTINADSIDADAPWDYATLFIVTDTSGSFGDKGKKYEIWENMNYGTDAEKQQGRPQLGYWTLGKPGGPQGNAYPDTIYCTIVVNLKKE